MTRNKQQFFSKEVKEYNKLLGVISKSIQFGFFTPKEAIELEKRIKSSELNVLVFKVNKHGIPNISGVDNLILETLHKRLNSVYNEKVVLVKKQQYESAAIVNDKQKKIVDEISLLIQEDLKLREGFNYYNNMLLIVTPRDVNKSIAMRSILQNLEISTDEKHIHKGK